MRKIILASVTIWAASLAAAWAAGDGAASNGAASSAVTATSAATAPASSPAGAAAATMPQSQPASQPAFDAPAAVKALGQGFAPMVEKLPAGEIDWTAGTIRAIGVGKLGGNDPSDFLKAQRAARLVAARNAILLLSGLSVGPGGRFGDVRSGRIEAEGILRDFKETDSDYDARNDTVISVISVPIYGVKGAARLMGVRFRQDARPWAAPAAPAGAQAYAFICVDARGLGLSPAVGRRLVTEQGEVVVEASLGDGPAARYALAAPGKAGDIAPISAQPQRPPPLAIKPLSVTAGGDLVVGARDLAALAQASNRQRLLETGAVVIVIDPPAAEKKAGEGRSRTSSEMDTRQ